MYDKSNVVESRIGDVSHASVDGREAVVVTVNDYGDQEPMVDIDIGSLSELLARKHQQILAHAEVQKEVKIKAARLEHAYDQIHLEIRMRGVRRADRRIAMDFRSEAERQARRIAEREAARLEEVHAEADRADREAATVIDEAASAVASEDAAAGAPGTSDAATATSESTTGTPDTETADGSLGLVVEAPVALAVDAPNPLAGVEPTPCKSCKKPIVFAISPALAELPIDVESTALGSYTIGDFAPWRGGALRPTLVKVPKGAKIDVRRFDSHYKTCDDPNRFSHGRGGAKPTAPSTKPAGRSSSRS